MHKFNLGNKTIGRGRGRLTATANPGLRQEIPSPANTPSNSRIAINAKAKEVFSTDPFELNASVGMSPYHFTNPETNIQNTENKIFSIADLENSRFLTPNQTPGAPICKPSGEFQEMPRDFSQNCVSLNLPKFQETNVPLWFLTAENLFRLRGIFDEKQMCEFLLVALDFRHLERVQNVLNNLNPVRPYSQMRVALLEAYEPSTERKLDELLYATELGDSRPTELLARMKSLMGSDKSPALLKKLFLSKLPADVKRVIVAGGMDNIDELALRADRVLAIDLGTSSPLANQDALSAETSSLQDKVNELTVAVNEIRSSCSTDQRSSARQFGFNANQNGLQTSRRYGSPFTSTPRYYSQSRPSFNPINKFHPVETHKLGKSPRSVTPGPPRVYRERNKTSRPGFLGSLNFTQTSVPQRPLTQGLMFIKDPETHVRFLIDTGSKMSVLPCWRPDNHPSITGFMVAANGSKVPLYESVELKLSLNLNRVFYWKFQKARVQFPILGMDFLTHFNLTIEPRNQVLQCAEFQMPIPEIDVANKRQTDRPILLQTKNDHGPQKKDNTFPKVKINEVSTSALTLQEILKKYANVFDIKNFNQPPRHQTKHYIRTRGPPVCGRVRKLSPEKLDILKKELEKLTDLGVLVPSTGEYGSPVHLVPKKEPGSYRVTGDFRLLNRQTIPDKYAIPLLTDFVDLMSGSKCFSSLDLYKSYHQIEVANEDIHKTAILTPFGSFAFKKMPMGLTSAGNTFQRFMNEVLRGLDFVYVYIDDILIFSKNHKEHLNHLTKVFERLSYYGLILNERKCVFCSPKIEFLGHEVSNDGVRPLDSKIEAIRDFPQPTNMRQLRRFLGMVNFYRRFIPNAAEILHPLDSMLSPHKSSGKAIAWDENTKLAFETIKEKLINVARLAFPVLGAQTTLVTDASGTAVGGVLQQVINGESKPVAFFSKSLNSAQRNYSAFDRELLAMYLSVRHFRYFLEGRPFAILTDHKPLTHAFGSPMKDASARQLRQLNYISEFTTNVHYIEGERNVVADCLSRSSDVNALFEEMKPLDFNAMSDEQLVDPDILDLVKSDKHSLSLEYANLPGTSKLLLGDVSQGQFRPLVPRAFRKKVCKLLHALSHPGIKASQKLISQRFVWPCMRLEIKSFVNTCIACQQTKINKHNIAPLQRFEVPDRRFQAIHLDLVGPLPPSEGYSYLMTMICRFTRHVECIPLKEITAKSCADCFLLHWVARFGVPETVTVDRGRQWTSNLWKELTEFLGTRLCFTTAYHPAANGMVERVHRTLKVALRCQSNPTNWHSYLGLVLLGMRSAVKEDLGCSSSEMTLGTQLRLPGQFFAEIHEAPSQSEYRRQLLNYMSTLRPTLPREPSKRYSHLDEALQTCTHVFIRNDSNKTALGRAYTGPYPVLHKQPKYFTIENGRGIDVVSIDRLKPANLLIELDSGRVDTQVFTPSISLHHSDGQDFGLNQLFENCLSTDSEEQASPAAEPIGPAHHFKELSAEIYKTRHGRSIHLPHRYR